MISLVIILVCVFGPTCVFASVARRYGFSARVGVYGIIAVLAVCVIGFTVLAIQIVPNMQKSSVEEWCKKRNITPIKIYKMDYSRKSSANLLGARYRIITVDDEYTVRVGNWITGPLAWNIDGQ